MSSEPSLADQGVMYWVGYGRMAGRGSSSSRTFGPWRITRRVERQKPLRRGEQGVDVDLLDPALLDDQVAEANQKLLERGQVHRLAAAHAFERREDLGLLHHPPGQGGIERRQPERTILEHFDELTPRAEKEHRAELRGRGCCR